MMAFISALAAALGTFLAAGIAIAVGRLVTWIAPAVPRPDPLVELWQEREVRAGRFPDGAFRQRKPGKPGSTKRKRRR